MYHNKPSDLLPSVASKHNNIPAQNGGDVFDSGVGLGKGLGLQTVGKIDEQPLLVPKLFRLEGINRWGFCSTNDMHALLCAEAALGTRQKRLIYCLCTYFEWFCVG